MAALSVRKATAFSLWISLILLLILIQMLTSLMLFAGVFIFSDDALISPFHWWYQSDVSGAESEGNMDTPSIVLILILYVPLVLVAFALLAMLLAAYAKDKAALWFSMASQAASSLLILTGIVGFLIFYWSYVSSERMTIGFYICVGVQVELAVITVLSWLLGRRLTSDWE